MAHIPAAFLIRRFGQILNNSQLVLIHNSEALINDYEYPTALQLFQSSDNDIIDNMVIFFQNKILRGLGWKYADRKFPLVE